MEITEAKKGQGVILGLNGRLDSSNSNGLEQKIRQLIDRGERYLVLDCSQLSYISSSGLRVLLMAAKKLDGITRTSSRGGAPPSPNGAGMETAWRRLRQPATSPCARPSGRW